MSSHSSTYDVVVIGAGIGGLFSAYELTESTDLDILLVEKGEPINERSVSEYEVAQEEVLRGVGGAGGWSDGKITLDPYVGTNGARLLDLPEETLEELTQEALEVFEEFTPFGETYGDDVEAEEATTEIDIEAYEGLHVGTDGIRAFSHNLFEHVEETEADIWLRTSVEDVTGDGPYEITCEQAEEEVTVGADMVVNASGLEGAAFTESLMHDHGVELATREADIGIRLETDEEVFSKLEDDVYDFKFYHEATDSDIEVRSFCVNHRGDVVTEYHKELGINAVNGHSRVNLKKENSNLAILATIPTDDQFGDPIEFVRETARDLNGSGHPLYQPLSDFLDEDLPERDGPFNDNVVHGDIRERLPEPVYSAYEQYIRKLDEEFPLSDYGGTIYAPEVKYFQYKMPLTQRARIPETDLYVVGNAAGRTSDLMGAAVLALRACSDIEARVVPADG